MNPSITDLEWRRVLPEDIADLTRIYNESIAGGGHSPMLRDATVAGVTQVVQESKVKRWPHWVLVRPATAGEDPRGEIVAWCHVRPISWGGIACCAAGDLWIYVARAWYGSGAAMMVCRHVYKELLREGFDTVTCWVLGSNRRSLSLVRACRMTRWALMPRVVRYDDREIDLEVWGVRTDDETWQAHMHRLDTRYRRLEARAARAQRPVPVATPAPPHPAIG